MNDEEFDDIAPVVLAAARTLTPYQNDLQGVRRRGTMRRRKRMIGASAVAAVVTMATVVTVSAALPQVALVPTLQAIPSATPSPSPPAMAQVLSLRAFGFKRTQTEIVGVIGYSGIMLADGSFRDHPAVPGVETQELVPMPGGGWVLRGLVNLAPGVSREDGPCVSDISTPLIVLDRDGRQLSTREIHRRCHPAYLVGVHGGRAFLARDNNFVTIDLSSGTESVFAPLGSSLPAHSGIEGGILYSLTPQDGQCPKLILRTVEIATGSDTSREITPPACGHLLTGPRLSPDGRRVAFVHTSLTGDREIVTSAVIADAATGTIAGSRVIPASPGGSPPPMVVGGMAWVDNATVRIVYALPPAQGLYDFRDLAKTIDISS